MTTISTAMTALAEMPCEKYLNPTEKKCYDYGPLGTESLWCWPCQARGPLRGNAVREVARLRVENARLREACKAAIQEMNTTVPTEEGNWPWPSQKVLDQLHTALAEEE